MRPIVTDQVACGLSVCHTSEPCKSGSLTGPRNHRLDGVQIPSWEWAILGERGAHHKV